MDLLESSIIFTGLFITGQAITVFKNIYFLFIGWTLVGISFLFYGMVNELWPFYVISFMYFFIMILAVIKGATEAWKDIQ
jgi:hypothetical protein